MACIYTEHPSEPVAEIRVVGRVTQHDMDEIVPKLTTFIERHGKIRLVETLEDVKGFDASAIVEGAKFDYRHLRDITHAAVVSDMGWIGMLTRVAGMVIPLTLRVFPLDQLDAARAWAVNPEPASDNHAA